MPNAGSDSHIVLRYGPPGSQTSLAAFLTDPTFFSQKPSTPFGLQTRQGNAKERDFAFYNTWEIINDWSGGAEHYIERDVQTNQYATAQGGPALTTSRKGELLPAPAVVVVDAARKDLFRFIEAPWNKFYALSNTNPGVVYELNATGTGLTAVETLSSVANTTGKQLITDGTNLYCTRGSTQKVRTTADGTTWSDHTVNADFYAIREGGVISYIAGATFQPAGSEGFTSAVIGWTGTVATNMVAYKGSVIIGKPEGLYRWQQGRVELLWPTGELRDTSNFTWMVIQNNILYFNIRNRLYFTDLSSDVAEIFPKDINGFKSVDMIAATSGPLLLGTHINPKATQSVVDEKSGLFMFGGINDPGLNPLWEKQFGTADATASSVNSPGTIVDDATSGTVAWTNPSNAGASDDVYASAVMGGTLTHFLKATNFGFSIPSNSIISGIKVEIERGATLANEVIDSTVKLVVGGNRTGAERGSAAYWPLTDTYEVYGSATDLWGVVLSPADVNASNFGVILQAARILNNVTARIDHIRMTVYYVRQDNWIGAGATKFFDAARTRVYACESINNGLVYFDLTDRFQPYSYKTDAGASTAASIQLTKFTASLNSVYKWTRDIVATCKSPNATTFMRIDASYDDGATFTQTINETGAAATITLNNQHKGVFLPNDKLWTSIILKIFMWTTDPTVSAGDITITMRGLILPIIRYQFEFPVDCRSESVLAPGFPAASAYNGLSMKTSIDALVKQLYPFDLQDLEGNWHRCAIKGAEFQPTTYDGPTLSLNARVYGVYRIVAETVLELSSTGTIPTWSIST